MQWGTHITLGMSEEEMKIRLGGNAFEEEEEEQGTSIICILMKQRKILSVFLWIKI